MADEEKSPMLGSKKRYNIAVICFAIVVIGATCVIASAVLYSKEEKRYEKDSVGVVVDAGGSGTRLIVYSYNGKGTLSQLKYIKCEREGLAKYTPDQFPALKEILNKCFDEGASSLPWGKKVPIYFAATAGMRLLKLRNSTLYNNVWAIVKECISASNFKTMTSGTISGFEEAKWGWIAANYLKHTLNTGDSFGTIDFGSSSLQLTFEQKSKTEKSADVKTLVIDGNNKTVYGHSYLCYGVNEMMRRFNAKLVKDAKYASVVKNPCYGTGYTKTMTSEYLWASPCSSGDYAQYVLGEDISGPSNRKFLIEGSSNFTQCHADLQVLLDRRCTKTSCGINNVFQPKLQDQHMNYFALSTFYYVGKTLKLVPSFNKSDYRSATAAECAKPYVAEGAGRFDYMRCFQSAYGYYLLNDGFGFPDDWNIEFIKKINGKKVGWPLGLMYTNKGEMYQRVLKYATTVKESGFIGLIVFGGVSVFGGIIFFVMYRKKHTHDEPLV